MTGRRSCRIAATGMREFGLEPDFQGLDADLGLLGEERPDVVAEFVAVAENAVRGSAVLTVKAEAIGKLSGLYVNPVHRGQGVGRTLLKAAVDAGRSRGLGQDGYRGPALRGVRLGSGRRPARE